MHRNFDRNKKILRLLRSKLSSYQIIADICGTTRNVVAGVAFRHRHSGAARARSPNGRGSPNKTGTGYQPQSYWPEKTALNTFSAVHRNA